MNLFDTKAQQWDNDPTHWERSEAIAEKMRQTLPITTSMTAMEYGAGTGILSFLLSESFANITLMDSSIEMVKVMQEKVTRSNSPTLSPILFDLEKGEYTDSTYDCIFTQMAMHHVLKIDLVLERFYRLLNPNGYLAITDLYTENGSFHGKGFDGHNGFDPAQLKKSLEKAGFTDISYEPCFVLKRKTDEGLRKYPVFLLTAKK
jgi:ubiquinone/menaquinone biosynthesis C-methylase UbiE